MNEHDSNNATDESNELTGYRVAVEVHCRRCGYDLRGLDTEHRCPECGLEIWLTLRDMVDPAASRLPRLHNPRGVGNGVLTLVLLGLLASTMLAMMAALHVLGAVTAVDLGPVRALLPPDLALLAAAFMLTGLWSVHLLMPTGDHRNVPSNRVVVRDLRWLALALVLWAFLAVLLWWYERALLSAFITPVAGRDAPTRLWIHIGLAALSSVALRGLQTILITIGHRSREYRRARGSRQGIRPMMAACGGLALGSALRLLAAYLPDLELLWFLGTMIVWISALMVWIGLAYMVVNAWWIRRALLRPPPNLADLVKPVPGRSTEPPPTEYFR